MILWANHVEIHFVNDDHVCDGVEYASHSFPVNEVAQWLMSITL
jgi:hypothetical protein